MRLFIDLDSMNLVSSPKSTAKVTALSGKRGDTLPLSLSFVSNRVEQLFDSALGAVLTLKHKGAYAETAVLSFSSFSLTGHSTIPTATVIDSGSTIKSTNVTSRGSGYHHAPTVSFLSDTGSGAAATAAISHSGVNSVTLTDGGSGYGDSAFVSLSGGGGSGATASCVVVNGSVASIYVEDGGSGYTSPPTVAFYGAGTGAVATASIKTAGVNGALITNPGSGYPAAPVVTFTAYGSGYAAEAHAVLSNGIVNDVVVTNGGGGYFTPPDVAITQSGSTPASVYAVVNPLVISQINITDGGYGYETNPHIVISGGGGVGASAVAHVVNGCVDSIDVINPGTGYFGSPVIELLGGSGSGAKASANISGGHLSHLTLINPGSGYAAPHPVNFYADGSSAPFFQGHAIMSGTSISGVDVAAAYYNQTDKLTITMDCPGATGFGGTVVMSPRVVTGFEVTDGGSGYSIIPRVVFSGGGGTGATAEVVVSGASLGMVRGYEIRLASAGSFFQFVNGATYEFEIIISSGMFAGVSLGSLRLWRDYVATLNFSLEAITQLLLKTSLTAINDPVKLIAGLTLAARPVGGFVLPDGVSVRPYMTVLRDGGSPGTCSIRVTNRGNGYTSVPTVTLVGATGSEQLVATVSNRSVSSVSILGMIAPKYLSSKLLARITMTNGGATTYDSTVWLDINPDTGAMFIKQPDNPLLPVFSNTHFSDIGSADIITVTLPSDLPFVGTGFALSPVSPKRWVTGITGLTGTHTATDPTVVITPAAGDTTGSGATARAMMNAGIMRYLVLTNTGQNYTRPPVITFTGGAGSGASAVAEIAAGGITSITVMDKGSNYFQPRITVNGATGAKAEALVHGSSVFAVRLIEPGTIDGVTLSAATLTTSDAVLYTAKSPGPNGNLITVAHVVSGTTATVASVVLTTTHIVVTAGSACSAATIITAVNASSSASAIVTASASGSGATLVSESPAVALSGGTASPNVSVTIDPPSARAYVNAEAVAVLDPLTASEIKPIGSIIVTNGGTGYWDAPEVVVLGASSTTHKLVAKVEAGKVVMVSIIDIGTLTFAYPPTISFVRAANRAATAELLLSGGDVSSVRINTPGSGYTNPPGVSFSGGGGSGAKAHALLSSGLVSDIVIDSPGSGYTSRPDITIGYGAGAVITANLGSGGAGGTIIGLNIVNGGSGYTNGAGISIAAGSVTSATATATVAGGVIIGYVLTNAGSGYLSVPGVTITGYPFSGSAGATAVATVDSGSVSSISVTASGSGYTSPAPVVTFASVPDDGGGATAEAVMTDGQITGIRVNNKGGGYTYAPSVVITHPYGNGASARAVIDSSGVTDIKMTAQGAGYLAPPTVVISGGSGSGAAAEAVMNQAGSVVGIAITSGGAGYRESADVTISRPKNGRQARASALLSAGVVIDVPVIDSGSGYDNEATVSFSTPPLSLFGQLPLTSSKIAIILGNSPYIDLEGEIELTLSSYHRTTNTFTFRLYNDYTKLAGGPYTLGIIPPSHGAISGGIGLYNSGSVVTLTAEPAAGFSFDGWTGTPALDADQQGANPLTILMDSNRVITAAFTD